MKTTWDHIAEKLEAEFKSKYPNQIVHILLEERNDFVDDTPLIRATVVLKDVPIHLKLKAFYAYHKEHILPITTQIRTRLYDILEEINDPDRLPTLTVISEEDFISLKKEENAFA